MICPKHSTCLYGCSHDVPHDANKHCNEIKNVDGKKCPVCVAEGNKEMTDKQHIQQLKDGECYTVIESDYGKAEIWRKYSNYYLFEIPMNGGEPRFFASFELTQIDELIEIIERWT